MIDYFGVFFVVLFLLCLLVINRIIIGVNVCVPNILIVSWLAILLVALFFAEQQILFLSSLLLLIAISSFVIGYYTLAGRTRLVQYEQGDVKISDSALIIIIIIISTIDIIMEFSGYEYCANISGIQELFYNGRKNNLNTLSAGEVSIKDNIQSVAVYLYVALYLLRMKYKGTSCVLFVLAGTFVFVSCVLTYSKQAVIVFVLSLFLCELFFSKDRINKTVFLFIVIFFCSLVGMIYLLNNAGVSSSGNVLISIRTLVNSYFLGGMYGFDAIVNGSITPGYNGGYLKPILAILYRLNLVSEYPRTHMEFYFNKDIYSNIYSGMYQAMQNFGYVELIIIMFANGSFYGFFTRSARKKINFMTTMLPFFLTQLILLPINGDLAITLSLYMIKMYIVYLLFVNKIVNYGEHYHAKH